MEEVEQLCDRIAIIDKGKVIASGTKEELKNMISLGETITLETYHLTEENIEEIKNIPNIASVDYNGQTVVVKSKKGKNNLVHVLNYFENRKISMGKIYSELPTLNDVFLEITGKELRD